MGAVVEHGGEIARDLAQRILTDDGEDDARRAGVLLGASVYESILGDVNGTAQDVGRHVGDKGDGAVHVLLDLGAVDGIVGRDVEIVYVGRDLVSLGDVGVVLVLGTCEGVGLADALGLLEGLVGPYARIEVSGLLLKEVHGHVEEFEAGAAAEEYDLVGIGNIEKFLPEGTALVHRGLPLLGAVRNGQHGHSRALEIFQCFDGSVNDRLGK